MIENATLILLIIGMITNISLISILISSKERTQIKRVFLGFMFCSLICTAGQTAQILFAEEFNIPPIYFDYIVYIGTCFLPVCMFFLGLIFANSKIKVKKKYLLLLIIPILSLIILWTNDYHHLFYKNYSVDYEINEYGPYFTVHNIYSYLLLFLGIWYMLKFSIKNAGFFSKQSILIILGISCPILVNILGTFKIIPMTIYYTPISFTITILLFFLAIFKFNFLTVTPIAMQKIVDRISDSYLVLNEKNKITDFNKTFLTTFNVEESETRGKLLEDFIKNNEFAINLALLNEGLKKAKNSKETFSFEQKINKINKIFSIEINTIYSDNTSLATLILFKDITQHKHDIETIKNTQESLMESERLSSLGQLIGGIAHNLKTPIMSIAGAAEGLTDLVKEYDESIDDPTVNSQDHHEIASDMLKWIDKIRNYTEYMSDIITTVKGQAVAMNNEEEDMSFTITELVKRINILMKHELKNAIISLNILCKVDEKLTIHGNVNNLVQVINNMISNAIQAYNGKTEEKIEFIISKENNMVVFSIVDYAGGLPEKVKAKLFKEMITTKGKNGTGLGLYMSYSTIKAHFNGNITYETETGKGTTFNISIPIE